MIRALLIDDSSSIRLFMRRILVAEGNIEVVSEGKDGSEALSLVEEFKPDVVVMDMVMPHMNGDVATQNILQKHAVPVVLYSSTWNSSQTMRALEAMESGAVAALPLPSGIRNPHHEEEAKLFRKNVRVMAGVAVVRRYPSSSLTKKEISPNHSRSAAFPKKCIKILAIGSSTGGPTALLRLLSSLPQNFPIPIIITQHIANGFLQGLITWFQEKVSYPCFIAREGKRLKPGNIYFAQENSHLEIKSMKIHISDAPPIDGLRPAVSAMFNSLADRNAAQVAAVLLTGMGKDGAQSLKRLHDMGAVTFVQDQEAALFTACPAQQSIWEQPVTYFLLKKWLTLSHRTSVTRINPVNDILIVEDSLTQAVRLDLFLKNKGFSTRRAVNGQEGLDQIYKSPIPDSF